MGKGLRKPLIACSSLIILLIAVIIGISIRGFNVVYSNSHLVVSDVIPLDNASSGISINLLTLETSLRGYMISKDDEYIASCDLAKEQLQKNIETIVAFSNQLPALQDHVNKLKPQVYALLRYYDRYVSLIKWSSNWNSYSNVKSGKTLMDNIKVTLSELNATIDKYSKKKIHDSEITKIDVTDILIAVSIAVFLLIAAIMAMVFEIINENVSYNTKQKKTLEKTIKDQEEFYANISHELKTPLNVILSTLQLLEMYNRNNTQLDQDSMYRYFKIMKQNSFRLSRLSNNLIDISKIEAGYIELNLRNMDLVSTIEDITQSVVAYAESKQVSLLFDTDVEEKIMAFDADKIERIMLNLLSNAFKFTNPGDDILVLVADLGKNVSITVKDSGIGIPEDKLEVIFDRFKQVDKSLTRNTEGSGIGLSLTKSLVAMHGGTISATSVFGQGSEFTFILPVKLLDANDDAFDISRSSIENDSERISIEFSDIYFD